MLGGLKSRTRIILNIFDIIFRIRLRLSYAYVSYANERHSNSDKNIKVCIPDRTIIYKYNGRDVTPSSISL